ncbi:malate:quinone oxidoreductase, partial [Domibacillus sp. 8LH]|uniref:malate:quinone oxidoreductase n=1 Tax=Domibacillus sp. 8LH TaxID=3073900 RepID=UPI00317FCB11
MSSRQKKTDVILIGAGIMSATLGTILKELVPEWNIKVFEKLSKAGEESSNEWNNAGTGHAALCELNYTVE